MSEAPVPTLSAAAVGAQLAEIAAQRDAALTRCARLAGDKADLFALLKDAGEEIAMLKTLVAANADDTAH